MPLSSFFTEIPFFLFELTDFICDDSYYETNKLTEKQANKQKEYTKCCELIATRTKSELGPQRNNY